MKRDAKARIPVITGGSEGRRPEEKYLLGGWENLCSFFP
jgi:hypothetical protein